MKKNAFLIFIVCFFLLNRIFNISGVLLFFVLSIQIFGFKYVISYFFQYYKSLKGVFVIGHAIDIREMPVDDSNSKFHYIIKIKFIEPASKQEILLKEEISTLSKSGNYKIWLNYSNLEKSIVLQKFEKSEILLKVIQSIIFFTLFYVDYRLFCRAAFN